MLLGWVWGFLFLSFDQPADSANVKGRRLKRIFRRRPEVLTVRWRMGSWRGAALSFPISKLKLSLARLTLPRPSCCRLLREASFGEGALLGATICSPRPSRAAGRRSVRRGGGVLIALRLSILDCGGRASRARHNSLSPSAGA